MDNRRAFCGNAFCGGKIKCHKKQKELRVYGQVGKELIGNLS